MSFDRVPERERALTKLVDYLATQPDGAYVGYVEVEQATGVRMASVGEHRLLYSALRRLKRQFIPKAGAGVILSSPDNAGDIASSIFRKTRRCISRSGRRSGALLSAHGNEMPADSRARLVADNALFRTVESIVKARSVVREVSAAPPPAPMLPKKV